uniref:Uncharacterized protein n=1 Tax=Athene cunicularia TaxID=194338 RepID=A0A663LX15_ATHCN
MYNHQQNSTWTCQYETRVEAGLPSGERGLDTAQGIHKHVCACEPAVCPVCAALVTCCLCQPRRRSRLGCLPLCLCESSTGVLLEAASPLWKCPLCVCILLGQVCHFMPEALHHFVIYLI